MLALSLTGYPFYNSPSEFANYVNFSLVYLNPDDIEGIMKRVSWRRIRRRGENWADIDSRNLEQMF